VFFHVVMRRNGLQWTAGIAPRCCHGCCQRWRLPGRLRSLLRSQIGNITRVTNLINGSATGSSPASLRMTGKMRSA
jgi:hypothetical protein